MFQVQEARREKIWVKLALMGPSGSGKTYSSLRIATGMLEELTKLGDEKNGKILISSQLIDYICKFYPKNIVNKNGQIKESQIKYFEWHLEHKFRR
jgi:ABC-type multidrug transport system ATPase subunit